MASKIKDTHASWQNLFNRDAITPRLESKDQIIQPTYQKIICRIYTYLVIIQMITLKKKVSLVANLCIPSTIKTIFTLEV